MKAYETPELELVRFPMDDVICSSQMQVIDPGEDDETPVIIF